MSGRFRHDELTRLEKISPRRPSISSVELRSLTEGAAPIELEGDRYAPPQMAMVGREAAQKADA